MTTHYLRAKSVLWRNVGDRMIFLPVHADADGGITTMTGSGAALWDVLATPVSADAAVQRVAQLHDLPPEQVDDGVRGALRDLLAARVVKKVDSS